MLDKVALEHWLSATQIDTFGLCERKWGWYKLNGIKGPPNIYAERGLGVHKVAEKWLGEGIHVDTSTEYGRIFSAGIKFLPPPKVPVEQRFNFKSQIAVYIGLWDVHVPIKEGVVRIIDHKTTSDFKWMKSPKDLCTDTQAILYAVAVLGEAQKQGIDISRVVVQLDWVYYRANEKKPGARLSRLYIKPDDIWFVQDYEKHEVLTQQELSDAFDEIEITSKEMLEHHRQEHKALDLDYNVTGCNAYGGCPYRGNPCKLSTSDIIRGHMTQQSLAEKIAARKKEAAGEDKGESSSEGEGGGSDLASRIKSAKSKAKPAASEASPAVVKDAADATAQAAAEAQEGTPEVNPPDEAEAPSKGKQGKMPAKAGLTARQALAGEISGGIAGARIYPHTEPNYADNVGNLSLEIADVILNAG